MSLGGIMKTNLKILRKEKGLTQIALQMRTGIEQALLSKFENGERIPPTDTLIRLADFYEVSIDYILCRTDNPEIKWNFTKFLVDRQGEVVARFEPTAPMKKVRQAVEKLI